MYWQGCSWVWCKGRHCRPGSGAVPQRKFWHFKVESMDGCQYRQLFTMFGTPQGLNMWLTNECSWITVSWSLGSYHLSSPLLGLKYSDQLVSNQYSHYGLWVTTTGGFCWFLSLIPHSCRKLVHTAQWCQPAVSMTSTQTECNIA